MKNVCKITNSDIIIQKSFQVLLGRTNMSHPPWTDRCISNLVSEMSIERIQIFHSFSYKLRDKLYCQTNRTLFFGSLSCKNSSKFLKSHNQPWLSGLHSGLWTKGFPVWFPVGVHAWVDSQVPRQEATTHWYFFPSLSPSLPFCLKVNK